MNTREELIDWLHDAHAMERGIEVMLTKQINNDEVNASVRERCRIHLEETKTHAAAVEDCLKLLNSDTSAIKSGTSRLMEMAKGMVTAFARDERIKDLLAAYATEHFEIACYKALIAGAQRAGVPQIVPICERIIADEQSMAQWIDQNLPAVTTQYLDAVSTGAA